MNGSVQVYIRILDTSASTLMDEHLVLHPHSHRLPTHGHCWLNRLNLAPLSHPGTAQMSAQDVVPCYAKMGVWWILQFLNVLLQPCKLHWMLNEPLSAYITWICLNSLDNTANGGVAHKGQTTVITRLIPTTWELDIELITTYYN